MAVGALWVLPAALVLGMLLAMPAYALSLETFLGMAFGTRWINETAVSVTSLTCMREPLHRRYIHTSQPSYL